MGGHFGKFEAFWDLLRQIGDPKVTKEGDQEQSRGPKRPQEGPTGPQSGEDSVKNDSKIGSK